MIISNERLVEYFERSNLNVVCPACQSIGWAVNAAHIMDTNDKSDDRVVNHIPYARIDEETNKTITFMGGYPIVFLICKSCGYLRMHSYALLHSKIKEMDESKGAEKNNG